MADAPQNDAADQRAAIEFFTVEELIDEVAKRCRGIIVTGQRLDETTFSYRSGNPMSLRALLSLTNDLTRATIRRFEKLLKNDGE